MGGLPTVDVLQSPPTLSLAHVVPNARLERDGEGDVVARTSLDSRRRRNLLRDAVQALGSKRTLL